MNVEALEKIVGSEYVTTSKPILQSYLSRGIMGIRCELADIVVKPSSTEEVQQILRFANERKIPVCPMSGGLSGGYALPYKKGGILLDLSRMNRILEVDEDARYMVVEPGVTSGEIWSYFRKNHPEWVPPIPDGAPPAATVVGDVLERGFSLVTSKYGPQADYVLGLEVVLPTGEIVKTGSWCIKGVKPFYRWGIGPNFDGLLMGAQGTFGVVTKLAVKIFPHPPIRDLVALSFDDPETLQELTLDVMKKEVGVMVQGGNWQLVTGRKPKDELPQDLEEFRKKKYWVPKYMMNFEIWGDESEIARQKEIIFSAVERYRKEGAKVAEWKLPPVAKEARLKKPNKIAIPYAQHEVGFLFITWYLPWKDTASCIRLWEKYMVKYGFTPVMWVASIEHGRECIGMPIVCFDWTDAESVKKVEEMDKEVTEISLDRGWINYRCNAGIHAPAHMKRAPEYYELLKKLKKFFDPNGIMHPGRLCL